MSLLPQLLLALLVLLLLAIAVLLGLRVIDAQADRNAWAHLAGDGGNAGFFDPDSVQDLPEPARRYFGYAITSGTPLYRAVRIEMSGRIGLGTRESPGYREMRADQILAPPRGLVWKMRAGAVGGSDGALADTSWTRFRIFGLLPVVRAGGDEDHRRAAFGRVVAEAAIWAPQALLSGENVHWKTVGPDTARAVVHAHGLEQAVDITVAADGQPTQVLIQRWSNANAEHAYRLQPFGGPLSDFREVSGYRLPFRVEGGNHFGTPDYFPFFQANVTRITFP